VHAGAQTMRIPAAQWQEYDWPRRFCRLLNEHDFECD
jgi:hypothetical protein